MQLESPPMKNPRNPSLLQISLAAEYIDVYPWKQASSKRVSIMLSGFVRKVLISRERDETRKFWPADIRSIQNARRPVKQMQHPKAALRVAAANPLQKPRMPSALQIYLQEVLVLVNTLLASWMGLSSRGGSMSAILIFSKGWRRAVVITPLNIPQKPFSLIMPCLGVRRWKYIKVNNKDIASTVVDARIIMDVGQWLVIAQILQFYNIQMCFGPPQQPKTPKAATFRTAIQVLMVVQAVILVLNFVAAFITQGIFGILFAFLLFIIQRHLSHQAIIFFIFFSIFFAVNFMVAFLVPIQNETNFDSLSSMDKYKYADAVLSFVYYVFCAIFFFYPYREFKSIQYSENPALRAYFEANTQQTQQNKENKDARNEDANYDINYGNIAYDEKKRNNDNGTFQVFKGKGVRIG